MAEGGAAGEQRPRRKLARALLTCLCVTACRKEQHQLAPTNEDDTEHGGRVRRRPSTAVDEKPLRKIADAFKQLAEAVTSENSEVEVAAFARACSFVAPLFGCVGFHFKFIEMDYVTKVLITNTKPSLDLLSNLIVKTTFTLSTY